MIVGVPIIRFMATMAAYKDLLDQRKSKFGRNPDVLNGVLFVKNPGGKGRK